MGFVGKSVYQGGRYHWVSKYFFPAVEAQVCRDNDGLSPGPQRKVVEQKLGTLFVERDISKLVAYDKVIFFKLCLHLLQCAFGV